MYSISRLRYGTSRAVSRRMAAASTNRRSSPSGLNLWPAAVSASRPANRPTSGYSVEISAGSPTPDVPSGRRKENRPRPGSAIAVTWSSLRAACRASVGRGTIRMRRPMARPTAKQNPTPSPVNEPGPVTTATLVTFSARAIWRRVACSSPVRAATRVSLRSPFRVATAAVADDVSMTKIMRGPDQAAVAAEVLELDHGRAVDLEALAPLDHHRAAIRQLIEPEVAELGAVLDPVQVHVGQLKAAGIDAHQLEGRAGHVRSGPGASRDAADIRRLAGAELADQQHHVALAQALAQKHAGALRLGRRA